MSTRPDSLERERIRSRLSRELGRPDTIENAPVVMAYPSPYRTGMSSLGYQTLYRLLNEQGTGAHRAFLPDEWERMSLAWPQPKRPVLSYESERIISDYPIVAVSVAYELEISGLIRLLEGSGIPLLAADRGPRDPFVVAGGPLTNSNPSILLPFVDLLICGEAEGILPSAIDRLLSTPGSRDTKLAEAASLPHSVVGEIEKGHFETLPFAASAPRDQLPAYSSIISPDTELSNMFLIEPERGCSRRCTFCVMRGETSGGMKLLPMEETLRRVPEYAPRVGLVGAAVTDHPRLEELVEALVDRGKGVGISSLRADRLSPRFLENLARGGYRSITVASDGISERMRQYLDRKISDQDLLRAAELVAAHKFHHMKVYQMIGVPGESDDDVEELIAFAQTLSRIVPLVFTFSTFVSKRNTPLDGRPFVGVETAQRRLKRIQKALRGKVDIRPQPPKWAYIEYLLAQRGPEAGHAAVRAVHEGASYPAWKRALEALPPNQRELCFGNERRKQNRSGLAALRSSLPVLS